MQQLARLRPVWQNASAMTWAALPAFAASEADCQAMWKKADANNDGVLSEQESLQYSAMMRVHDKTLPPDGKLTQAAFMEACKGDVYTPRKNDAGAPPKGANSFTEGQAKLRHQRAAIRRHHRAPVRRPPRTARRPGRPPGPVRRRGPPRCR